jgi:hypothetical protein
VVVLGHNLLRMISVSKSTGCKRVSSRDSFSSFFYLIDGIDMGKRGKQPKYPLEIMCILYKLRSHKTEIYKPEEALVICGTKNGVYVGNPDEIQGFMNKRVVELHGIHWRAKERKKGIRKYPIHEEELEEKREEAEISELESDEEKSSETPIKEGKTLEELLNGDKEPEKEKY